MEPFLTPLFRDVLFQTGDVQAGLIEPRIRRLVRRDGGKDGVGCEESGASERRSGDPDERGGNCFAAREFARR
jgi:hypothetical protein